MSKPSTTSYSVRSEVSEEEQKVQDELADLFNVYHRLFYGNATSGETMEAYDAYQRNMTTAGYCPMTYYEDGIFRKI